MYAAVYLDLEYKKLKGSCKNTGVSYNAQQ